MRNALRTRGLLSVTLLVIVFFQAFYFASVPLASAEEEWGIELTLSNYYPVVKQGESIQILVKVYHKGGPTTWDISLYLSPPMPPPGVSVTFNPATGSVTGVGSYFSSVMTISVSEDVEPGVYYLNITAYGHGVEGGYYGEGGVEYNYWHYVAIPLTVRPKGMPDLIVENLTLTPSAPKGGDQVTFKATISNIGQVAAGPFLVAFLINNTLFHVVAVAGLESGGTVTVTTPPWEAVEGKYVLKCVVDPDNRVEEGGYYGEGELNNEAQITFEVAVKPSFKLIVKPEYQSVKKGESVKFKVFGESEGGFRGYVKLTVRLVNETDKLTVRLLKDRILVEPRKGMTVVANETIAELVANAQRDAKVGNYTIVVEGVWEKDPSVRSNASCTLSVVSVKIDEVKAFYKLDSFFLSGVDGILKIPDNQYFVKVDGEVDRVEFVVNGQVAIGEKDGEYYKSPKYNMAQVKTKLMIRVYGKEGEKVEKVVDTNVLPTPLWLRALLLWAIETGKLEVEVEPNAKFDNIWKLKASVSLPKEPMEGKINLKWLPIIGGVYGFKAGFKGSAALRSDRKAELMGHGEFVLIVASRKAGIEIDALGYIAIGDTVHLSFLRVKIRGYADIPIFSFDYTVDLGLFGEIGVAGGIGIFGNVVFELNATETGVGGDIIEGIKWVEGKGSSTLGGRAWGKGAFFISISVEGEAGITVTIYVPKPYWRGKESLELFAGIKVTVKIPILGSFNIIDKSVSWPSHYNETSTGWHWIPRLWAVPGYSEYVWPPGAVEGVFLNKTYIYAHPSVAEQGGAVVLVWVHDDLSKPHVKGYEIYYSVWDDEAKKWSSPAPITDDFLHQGDPVVAFDRNGKAVCVWGEITDPGVNNTTNPLEVLRSVELAYSVWDPATGTWSKPEKVTRNTAYEMAHGLFKGTNGDLVLVWISDEDADLSTAEDWTIYVSRWTGTSWSEPMAVARGVRITTPPTATTLGDKIVVAWCQHTDGNFTTLNDTEVYYALYDGARWSGPKRLTNDYVEDEYSALTSTEELGVVLVSVKRGFNDTLVFYRLEGEEFGEATPIITRPRIAWPTAGVNSVGELVVTWLDGLRQTPVLMTLYRGNASWIGPLELTNTSLYQRDYSLAFTGDGRVVVAEIAGTELNDSRLYTSWREIVMNSPPKASFSYSPEKPRVGEEVRFTDTSEDPEGLVEWRWEFGDGETSSKQNPVHTYSVEGVYRVRLTVVDDCGLTSTVEKEVTVVTPTELELSVSPESVGLGEYVTVRGRMKPERGSLAIRIVYESPEGTTIEHTVITGADGGFEDKFKPDKAGVWRVKAVWEGDDLRLPSTSETVEFQVEIIPIWALLLIVIAAIVVLIVILLLARRKRR